MPSRRGARGPWPRKLGELAEHERPVPAADDVAELLDQRVELRATDVVVAVVDEARVAG